jgi:hypothetical protein
LPENHPAWADDDTDGGRPPAFAGVLPILPTPAGAKVFLLLFFQKKKRLLT